MSLSGAMIQTRRQPRMCGEQVTTAHSRLRTLQKLCAPESFLKNKERGEVIGTDLFARDIRCAFRRLEKAAHCDPARCGYRVLVARQCASRAARAARERHVCVDE
jgi:hypothetical protein